MGDAPRDVDPSHPRDWLKRLRSRVGKLRYYLVAEYGEGNGRPHYHAALFGFAPCLIGSRIRGACQCSQCSVVRETWGFGHVMVGTLGMASAAYIAAYTTKKMTHREDIRLYGRTPEFARMSLRPGIGAGATENVVSVMKRYRLKEVPMSIRFQGGLLPMGRYLRRRVATKVAGDGNEEGIRSLIGASSAERKIAEEVRVVRSVAWSSGGSVQEIWEMARTA